MHGCIAIVSDMIFATRIASTAKKLGTACAIVNDVGGLRAALASGAPGTVLVDMHCDGMSPEEAIRTAKSVCPAARVVAFFSHVHTDLMEQAAAAGADDVWPRSVFVQRLEAVLRATDRPGRR